MSGTERKAGSSPSTNAIRGIAEEFVIEVQGNSAGLLRCCVSLGDGKSS